MGVGQAIANGYMGKCEMVWTTAGTNRVCSRCMELRGRVVGTTDESSVTIPPLHPRCRCTIMYQEVEPAKALRPNKPQIGSSIKNSDSVLTPEQSKVYQTAEDMAYNARTNADFNFKKMANEPVWAKEIRFANGDGKGVGRRINCQRCVIAHEARMRGYDVIARPSWGKDDPLQKVGNWLKVFEDESREVYNCVGSTIKGIESFISMKMNEWGKGFTCICVV